MAYTMAKFFWRPFEKPEAIQPAQILRQSVVGFTLTGVCLAQHLIFQPYPPGDLR
jgi:hypothetical protein